MDLDSLKGKTLDDKTHADLVTYVTGVVEQRDAARKESIEGRKGKDAKLKELGDRLSAFAERLGVEVDVDLESLPTAKGQAEAKAQFEAQIKKLTRERDEAVKGRDDLSGQIGSMKRQAAISKAMEPHGFRYPDDVRALIERDVQVEGDDLLMRTAEGKLVPLADGVAAMAKARPDYLKPASTGGTGSGFKGDGQGGGAGKGPSMGGTREERLAAIQERFKLPG